MVSFFLLFLTLVLPVRAANPKPQPVVLKAVTCVGPVTPLFKQFEMFKDRVNQRAKGELMIEWVGASETISLINQASATASGVVDIAWALASTYTGLVPGAIALQYSEIPPQLERQRGAHDFLLGLHKKAGLYYLGRGNDTEEGAFYLFTRKQVSRPQELEGLKVGPGTIAVAGMKALGIIPINVLFPEIYTAMERNVIDGFINTLIGFSNFGWHEVSNYAYKPPFLRSNITYVMNLNTWNKLPVHSQELLKEVAVEMERDTPAQYAKDASKEWAIMAKAGMKTIEFTPTDAEWMLETIQKAQWGDVVKRFPDVGPKLVELLSK